MFAGRVVCACTSAECLELFWRVRRRLCKLVTAALTPSLSHWPSLNAAAALLTRSNAMAVVLQALRQPHTATIIFLHGRARHSGDINDCVCIRLDPLP